MDIRRLRRLQNSLPARVSSPRKRRGASRQFAERASLNSLLAWLETGRPVWQSTSFTLWAMAALFALLVFTGIVAWEIGSHPFSVDWLVGICLLLPAILAPCALRLRADAERQRALLQLTGYDDLRVIAPLTEGLFARDRRLRHASRIALTRLLPRLQSQDRGLLASQQRERLYRCLAPRHAKAAPELACAARQALQQIGDKHALSEKLTIALP